MDHLSSLTGHVIAGEAHLWFLHSRLFFTLLFFGGNLFVADVAG